MRTFGIERERFILNAQGKIVPAIQELLPCVHQIACERGVPKNLFSFELFAGQVEDRTPPCQDLDEVKEALLVNDKILLEAARTLKLSFDYSEFIEEERVVAFEVNPFDKRHQEIWASISHEKRIAASLVSAVHVHISVNEKEAVRILNLCRKNIIDHLICIGDHSGHKRINVYRIMAETDGVPPMFADFSEIVTYIASKGGEKNVWDFVRFKPSTGTIEFRMFGSTPSVEEILGYVNACRDVAGV